MILKSQLENIIIEEAEKVLFERMIRRAVVHSLTEEQIRNIRETGGIPEELVENILRTLRKAGAPIAFALALLNLSSAMAADITSAEIPTGGASAAAAADFADTYMGQDVAAGLTVDPMIKTAFKQMRDQLADEFGSDEAAEDYARFYAATGAPGFESDEEAKDYYRDTLGPKYIDAILNTDVDSTVGDRNNIPDDVLKHFTDNPGVGGLYDPVTDTIYVNPHSFAATGEVSDRKIFEMALEELIHAAVEDMELGDVLPGLSGEAYAGVEGAPGKIFAKIQGSVEGALTDGWQQHIDATGADAVAGELYAKLRAVKSELKSEHPDFFDSSGKIDTEKLKDLINNPDNYDLNIDIRILNTLDPDSDNLGTAFDILAKAGSAAEKRAIV
jgi:hypothetical protein